MWEKTGNDAADRFAKRGAGVHPSAEAAAEEIQACALVVREAARWAAEQEAWLVAHDLRDSQSITEPALAVSSSSVVDLDAVDAAGRDDAVCSGAFRGHRVVAFQRSIPGEPPALGCLRCGAYAIVRAGRLRRPCRGARTAQQRRCRDALLAERDPVHPHEAMHGVRQPTRGELEWLSRPVLGKRQPGLRDQAAMGSMPDRSDVLRRFGLADPEVLQAWQRRASRPARAVQAVGGDDEELCDDEELWE